jgi:DNA topoisomerase-6 subunit B
VRHRRREADAERKRQYITKYIPHIGIALREILDLTEKEESKVVRKLEDMLEKSRKL